MTSSFDNEGLLNHLSMTNTNASETKEVEPKEVKNPAEHPKKNHNNNNSNSGQNRSSNRKPNQDRQQNYVDRSLLEKFYASSLRTKPVEELMQIAEDYKVDTISGLQKRDIIYKIIRAIDLQEKHNIIFEGTFDLMVEGYGFLRYEYDNYHSASDNVYVPTSTVRKFNLRTGDVVSCDVRGPRSKEKYFSVRNIETINGQNPYKMKFTCHFNNLVPCFPTEPLNLEVENSKDLSNRIISLFAPIGKGQRALIVAPPRSGKTVLMQNIAKALNVNHPDVHLIVLNVDERPEEVTDIKSVVKGEIISSTFDENPARHVAIAKIVMERSKRLVEQGRDVVILLDSITRLARASNAVTPSSGKVLSGGVDANAMQLPKKFFGAARNVQNGGSLTIIATALTETGSKMDEVIFEEFKGTGNCEIVLDRKLSDKRVFPAMDILKSGTRREDQMIDQGTLVKMWMIRKIISGMSLTEAIEFITRKVKDTPSNKSLFELMNSMGSNGS